MRREARAIAPLALLLLLSSCLGRCVLTPDEEKAAWEAIDRFHTHVNLREYARIYEEADPEFHESATAEQFASAMTQLETQYGRHLSFQRVSIVKTVNISAARIEVVVNSRYSKRSGQEHFVFRLRDGVALMTRYDMNEIAPRP
ncbi:MAG TPA: hypothetical protein VMR86_22765 [Myxococcota bacterium]|nr:hypothetical protein [Myxococcota bacterium]